MPYARATDGIRLYYEEHGPTGPGRPGTARRGEGAPAPLVLAYGIGGNTDMWAPNTPGLAAGRRVILWEPRGHARSGSPPDPARYSFRRWALDLRDILDHLGLRRAHVGGLSLGAGIATRFALLYPRRVRSLVVTQRQGFTYQSLNGAARGTCTPAFALRASARQALESLRTRATSYDSGNRQSARQVQILEAIGAGGMGEVFRARDTKLNRYVAVKVLPDLLAARSRRIARFRREAQVLAAINHTNIAHLHELDDSTGVQALIMELVEGPTLADRIAQGPIPVNEALSIATQIAEALAAAHDQGVVHRDLKPANIKVRDDGTVKVLDFGLAKLGLPESSDNATSSAHLPTVTTPAMTLAGVVMGTAAYMSPEQSKGRPADKRSDVWAFGAVLYEVLTGRRAFEGEDVAETLANVLKTEPDWAALPADVPGQIRALLKRCLVKDRRARVSGHRGGALRAQRGLPSASAAHTLKASRAVRCGAGC